MSLKLRSVLTLALLVTGGTVDAQGPPVNSPDYHAIHNAQSPYYQGPRPAQQAAPDRPTGYWQKTWGAIAPSPVGGVLGTAVGASSKKEAERLALEDCKAKGGEACKVNLAYHNQCAAMVLGDKFFNSFSNATIEEAVRRGLNDCKENDTNCEVYYSACSEPIFYRY
jgi:hypothetical protein